MAKSNKTNNKSNNNIVLGCINFVSILLSIPIIFSGIYVSTQSNNLCVNILQWPLTIFGILVLVLSISGIVGGFWRINWLIIFHLVSMFVLITFLACLVVLLYIVTLRASPENRLDDSPENRLSGWLRRWIEDYHKWDGIRSCLSSSTMCAQLNQKYKLAQDFFNAHITPLQSGCCKPPKECGHKFVNPTYWMSPTNMGSNMDCLQWSNDQTQLCYSCDSCKAGLLANLYKQWRKVDFILGITLLGLICVFLSGCCLALRNTRAKTKHHSQTNNIAHT